MRAFVWWLRSTFCKHAWRTVCEGSIEKAWPPSMVGQETGVLIIKECTKCGWRWTQRSGL